jgi:hypothetical protein
MGYKAIWRQLKAAGEMVGRDTVQAHCNHLERTVLTAVADAQDRGVPVSDDWFVSQGIELPPEGTRWVAATVEQVGPDGQKHWVRVRPTDLPDERVELRQAQPVEVQGRPSMPTVHVPGTWQTWLMSPDAQIGYWLHSDGSWVTIHDERCFSVGHQIAWAVAESDGLHGWIDAGDFADLAAPSRHNPTSIDLHVEGLNRTWQRGAEEFARRRALVGPEGEVVVTGGNHDARLQLAANKQMPYLVGMKRANDPDDEHPVLTVPYLMRARDYGVEWVDSFPSAYRRLNSNLVVIHSPAYGSKALDTARKIMNKIHASVYFGHIHRREALADNIETTKGARTMEAWSDGTWARIDGSLPGANSSFDEYGNRLIASASSNKVGILGPSMQQGMSVTHVEIGGRERFSVERIAFWDGWAQYRGQTFEADCDQNRVAA